MSTRWPLQAAARRRKGPDGWLTARPARRGDADHLDRGPALSAQPGAAIGEAAADDASRLHPVGDAALLGGDADRNLSLKKVGPERVQETHSKITAAISQREVHLSY